MLSYKVDSVRRPSSCWWLLARRSRRARTRIWSALRIVADGAHHDVLLLAGLQPVLDNRCCRCRDRCRLVEDEDPRVREIARAIDKPGAARTTLHAALADDVS